MKAYHEHCRLCGAIGRSSQSSSQSSSQYNLLLKCIERISSLEREVAALKTKGVRRVNVLVWLDNNIKPKSSYIDHFRSHPMSDNWLDIGRDASTMFAEWCADSLSTSDPPLRTFSSMKHTLFRYDSGKWKQLTSNESVLLMRVLQRRFLQELQMWATQNPSLMQCDRSNARYFERLRRLTNRKTSEEVAVRNFCIALSKHIATKSPPGIILKSSTD